MLVFILKIIYLLVIHSFLHLFSFLQLTKPLQFSRTSCQLQFFKWIFNFCFKCKWQQMSWCLITSVWEIQLHDRHLFFRIMGDTHSQVLRSSSSISMGHSPPVLHAFPNPCFLKLLFITERWQIISTYAEVLQTCRSVEICAQLKSDWWFANLSESAKPTL